MRVLSKPFLVSRTGEEGDYSNDVICALAEPNICTNSKLKNSIAAGCPYAGFVAPRSSCTDNDNDEGHAFYNNFAHSVAGNGALIYPDPEFPAHKSTYYQGNHLSSYKYQE